jgi:hypothetical protein
MVSFCAVVGEASLRMQMTNFEFYLDFEMAKFIYGFQPHVSTTTTGDVEGKDFVREGINNANASFRAI